MKRSQEVFEEIESYLNGTLSSEATKAFEARVAENEALRKELALHKSLHAELGTPKELEFRALLNRISEAQAPQAQKSKFPWKIAASIALLVGASVFFYLQTQGNDGSLFKEYYSPYAVEDQLRGTKDNQHDAALKTYAAGDYKKAVVQLSDLLEQKPNDAHLRLYYGNCLLNLDRVEEAILIFKSFDADNPRYEHAQWYLAMAHLKNGDSATTKTALDNVVTYDGIYKQQAIALLRALE